MNCHGKDLPLPSFGQSDMKICGRYAKICKKYVRGACDALRLALSQVWLSTGIAPKLPLSTISLLRRESLMGNRVSRCSVQMVQQVPAGLPLPRPPFTAFLGLLVGLLGLTMLVDKLDGVGWEALFTALRP